MALGTHLGAGRASRAAQLIEFAFKYAATLFDSFCSLTVFNGSCLALMPGLMLVSVGSNLNAAARAEGLNADDPNAHP